MKQLNNRQNKLMQIRDKGRSISIAIKAKKQVKIHPKTPSRYPSM